MKAIQRLIAPFQLAAVQPAEGAAEIGKREFLGVTAVYGNAFQRWSLEECVPVWTVLEPGAFAKSIEAINSRPGDRAGRIPLMWEHRDLMGRTLSISDQPDGVYVHCRVTDAPEPLEHYAHVLDGSADGMSVGFNILASETVFDEMLRADVEHVTEGELLEVTACVWGANPLALIQAAASARLPGVPEARAVATKQAPTAPANDTAAQVWDLAQRLSILEARLGLKGIR